MALETGITIRSVRQFGLYSEPSCSVTYPNRDQAQTLPIALVVKGWAVEISGIDLRAGPTARLGLPGWGGEVVTGFYDHVPPDLISCAIREIHEGPPAMEFDRT